jgi:outer membrane biosynthesis protein TonB
MTERRRRRLSRDALVFAGSVAFHIGLFFVAASEFNFYNLPQENAPAVEVEIVPQAVAPIPPPPPMPPVVRPTTQPAQTPPSPQTQSQPQPQPQKPAPTPAPLQPAPAPSAPAQVVHAPTPLPAPKTAPSPAPTPLAAPAPTSGAPKAVPQASVASPQAAAAVPAPHIVLHKSREAGSPLEPGLNLPGATFAPPAQAASAPPGGGAPSGAGGRAGGGLPTGQLPGFGSGLRGGPLGCANAAVLHLSREEQARCDEAFGEGALQSPRMDAIGSSKRQTLDAEAAQEDAARKYRDSTPSGSAMRPTPGQPRLLQPPGQ